MYTDAVSRVSRHCSETWPTGWTSHWALSGVEALTLKMQHIQSADSGSSLCDTGSPNAYRQRKKPTGSRTDDSRRPRQAADQRRGD